MAWKATGYDDLNDGGSRKCLGTAYARGSVGPWRAMPPQRLAQRRVKGANHQ